MREGREGLARERKGSSAGIKPRCGSPTKAPIRPHWSHANITTPRPRIPLGGLRWLNSSTGWRRCKIDCRILIFDFSSRVTSGSRLTTDFQIPTRPRYKVKMPFSQPKNCFMPLLTNPPRAFLRNPNLSSAVRSARGAPPRTFFHPSTLFQLHFPPRRRRPPLLPTLSLRTISRPAAARRRGQADEQAGGGGAVGCGRAVFGARSVVSMHSHLSWRSFENRSIGS
jgi:hypothetical protein